ncbi:hypothetical protein GPL06_03825 [Bacteroides salyersiae]|uniref:hypothetical protein n=1 Tax=Bacteroides salyersiae TaxID=291644 RepID=UPI001B8AFE80|nr:hypothetical protein [Bacteroides salyersiae]MBT9871956.1 hypothetical protein [Bacteroides salyersiae]QUT76133.1 hypothetical protein INE81_02607 [Bacteroides salyersiae]
MFNLITGIASIIGAIIAIWQCYEANKAVKKTRIIQTEVQKARDEIIKRKECMDFANLKTEAKIIENKLISYTGKNGMRGANATDIKKMQLFLSMYNENKSKTQGDLRSFFDNNYNEMDSYIKEFSIENQNKIQLLLKCIRTLIGKLSENIESKIFDS